MRILHTADWHLGQHLCDKDRDEEHRLFLEFLIEKIHENEIDILIIAGDIFDNANPPNASLRQYYNFLKSLTSSPCKHTIIIGGNHDSVSTLNAPRALLQSFNISVFGGVTADLQDEIVPVKDATGKQIATICAVPFLRDRDIRTAVAGELYGEREKRIKEGMRSHYSTVADLAQQATPASLPIIATGHLFAAGSRGADSEKDIHLGNLGQISADAFPDIFDYVALGHLHRPQMVGGLKKIRYSGSPIPLSFSEIDDQKQLLLVEFNGKKLVAVTPIPVPISRRLMRFKGSISAVKTAIELFEKKDYKLKCWAEVQLEMDNFTPDADEQVRAFAQDKELEILKVSAKYTTGKLSLAEQEEVPDLSELNVNEVFARKCESLHLSETDQRELSALFTELLAAMEEEKAQ
ncbi:MAG: exonuclease subunit SbcD [Calditrichaeota bacterium]|nr:MAG: exonuclease subunit SbcD [Calditrichota bacterium]